MTLTLQLTPEEARRVAEAQAQGIDVEARLHEAIARLFPEPREELTLEEQERLLDEFFEEEAANGKPPLEDVEAMLTELAEGAEKRPVLTREATHRASFYADHD